MSSANAFILDQVEILPCGKELNNYEPRQHRMASLFLDLYCPLFFYHGSFGVSITYILNNMKKARFIEGNIVTKKGQKAFENIVRKGKN